MYSTRVVYVLNNIMSYRFDKCFSVSSVEKSLPSLCKLRSVNCYEIFFNSLVLHLRMSEYPINLLHCNNFFLICYGEMRSVGFTKKTKI